MQDPRQLPADIRDHLEAENAWAEAATADAKPLRERLTAELRARIREDDSTVPQPHGPWLYYLRYREGGQHPLICRSPRDAEARETVLLDGDEQARDRDYFRLVAAAHAPDHRLLACAVDYSGAERCSVRVRDMHSGEWLGFTIEDAQGDLAWSADGRHLFYTVLDEDHRPRWVYRRDLEAGADTLVFEETDPGFFVGVDDSETIRNAGGMLKEADADAVKLESGPHTVELTERLTQLGIPVMAHLGLTPQQINQLGGYTRQGTTEAAAEEILSLARKHEAAGAFALVLEHVPANVAAQVTDDLDIPTIGIGAGGDCDGQVLVIDDVLGLSEAAPPFAEQFGDVRAAMTDAIEGYKQAVETASFPAAEHSHTEEGLDDLS